MVPALMLRRRGGAPRRRRVGPTRRGHLGDPRGPPALHVLAADVLGRVRARGPSRESTRRARRHGQLDGCPDKIYRQIMSRGWCERRRAFVQRYDADVLDASILLMPLVKFISPTDPHWLSTLEEIGHELVSDRLVSRYDAKLHRTACKAEREPLDVHLLVCRSPRPRRPLDEARLVFEKMLTYANHLGLYAEEIAPTGEQLGGFPPGLRTPGTDQRRYKPGPPTRLARKSWPVSISNTRLRRGRPNCAPRALRRPTSTRTVPNHVDRGRARPPSLAGRSSPTAARKRRASAVARGHRQPHMRRRRAYPREHEGRSRAAPHEHPLLASTRTHHRTPDHNTPAVCTGWSRRERRRPVLCIAFERQIVRRAKNLLRGDSALLRSELSTYVRATYFHHDSGAQDKFVVARALLSR